MRALKELESYVWQGYSQKLKEKILNPQNAGYFESGNFTDRCLAFGSEGSIEEGNYLAFYILIDEEDHLIADAKYQAFGETPLIGGAEKACDLLIRKNLYQARRISADLIESSLRDIPTVQAFPKSCYEHINCVISAIDKALSSLPEKYLEAIELSTPLQPQTSNELPAYPEFLTLSKNEKLKIIQDVIDQDITPYIALDDGGATIKDIVDQKEVILSYSGTCTSCYSAIGSTLSAIEQTLKDKIHPDLIVTPDMESLNL